MTLIDLLTFLHHIRESLDKSGNCIFSTEKKSKYLNEKWDVLTTIFAYTIKYTYSWNISRVQKIWRDWWSFTQNSRSINSYERRHVLLWSDFIEYNYVSIWKGLFFYWLGLKSIKSHSPFLSCTQRLIKIGWVKGNIITFDHFFRVQWHLQTSHWCKNKKKKLMNLTYEYINSIISRDHTLTDPSRDDDSTRLASSGCNSRLVTDLEWLRKVSTKPPVKLHTFTVYKAKYTTSVILYSKRYLEALTTCYWFDLFIMFVEQPNVRAT